MSCNVYGSRPVQKLIENLGARNEDIQIVCSSLSEHLVVMTQDLNGNHVVQKCIRCFNPKNNQFIYDCFVKNCLEVATHRFGCCVLQAAIDHGTKSQQDSIIDAVEENCAGLTRDPFGNYVVQHVLDLARPDVPLRFVKNLEGQFHSLSLFKFSSNVVDKCLKLGGKECVTRILRELMDVSSTGDDAPIPTPRLQDKLVELALDPYGNYIVQACINESREHSPETFHMLVDVLQPVLHKLKGSPCLQCLTLAFPGLSIEKTEPVTDAPVKLDLANGHVTWECLPSDMLVVDVREIEEFAKDHYHSAINIPMGEFIRECTQPVAGEKFQQVKTAPMVAVYCGDGTRAKLVIEFSKNLGLSHLLCIEGGLAARPSN
eukprot:TRINITY_DN1886_c0_g1_i1.p1 TRINITY_DN1886_c0_g1~~TRINITY_DN1886_c0_g1_i1.p1  ORF type:complete len:374 (-),score=57.06 TRINITY_DN1886_c0_g1_i1:214-1335(-)